jgi:uncharacterized membrane protein YvbJ
MIECPACGKSTKYEQACTYCGAKLKQSTEDRFQMMAESVENALKLERKKRKQRKQFRLLLTALVIIAAIIVGLAAGSQ